MSSQPPRPPGPPRPRPAAPPPPQRGVDQTGFAIAMQGGPVCRSWDDFIAFSSQRWDQLREELVSGRLAAALARAGMGRHAPDANDAGTADERLDTWLAGLPLTKKCEPELDVHPARLELVDGPVATTERLRVRNVGHRLLKFRLLLGPEGVDWLVLPADLTDREVNTVEERTIDLTIKPGRGKARTRSATLVVESNGGRREVAVTVRAAASAASAPAKDQARRALAWWSYPVGGAVLGAIARLAAFGVAKALGEAPLVNARASASVCALMGLVAGAILLAGRPIERLASAVACLVGFVLLADVALSAERALQGSPAWTVWLSWTALGAVFGAVGGWAIAQRGEEST